MIMKRTIAVLATAALSTLMPSAALADGEEVVQLKAKDNVDLESGKAYIVYDTPLAKVDVFFMRSLSEDELLQLAEKREIALAERRARLRKRRGGAPGVSDEELLPDAEFAYADRSIKNLVRLDSGRIFEKVDDTRTYVVEVPPGEYTVFGVGIEGFASGACMCMGSVRFDARAGEITDLGSILVSDEDGSTTFPELEPYVAPEFIRRKTATFLMSVRPPADGDTVPAKFVDLPVTKVEYRAAPKFPNYLGMIVNRMPPIEGVLEYDRDIVIDLKAETAKQSQCEEQTLDQGRAEEEAAADVATQTEVIQPEDE